MKISPFKVEEWMNAYETKCSINIAETCCNSVSLNELCDILGACRDTFISEISTRRLTYGDIYGAPALLRGIAGLYSTILPENIITAHGAIGANNLVFISIVEPGDRVISVCPTYQQLYSIPESLGAETRILRLRRENGFLPDLDELRALAADGAKLICINNPNNPTGALIPDDMLFDIVEIARAAGAYLLCDEVYRGLAKSGNNPQSVADIYEKGISTGSMSKVFSLAGLRLGWIATKSPDCLAACLSHRDYGTISCGMFDEAIAALALSGAGKLLERNRTLAATNLEILDTWMRGEPHISYLRPQAGTTALLYYDMDIPSEEFCKGLLSGTGALLTPGSCFEEEGCARIGYACSTQELELGLEAISKYVASLSGWR